MHKKLAIFLFFDYLCKVKSKLLYIFLFITTIVTLLWLYCHAPLKVGGWTKQTAYVWLLDALHTQADNALPKIMLIDDDSGDGVFVIKTICKELDIKAAFAVIPKRMTSRVSDSLVVWQQDGFGIVLHGYDHDNWEHWSKAEVLYDIDISKKTLSQMGFDINQIKIIAPPYSRNTKAIRSAISDSECKMVTGANLVNPDIEVFQMGRILISKQTNEEYIKSVLKEAKEKQMFVILGTHSSDTTVFSKELTKNILILAKDLGFKFITNF